MKVQQDEIDRIIGKVLLDWKFNHLSTPAVPESKLRERLNEIFLKEMMVEDQLNKDVETMLTKYDKEFESGKLDRRKMFVMVKNQLAKERKIIL